MYKLMKNPDGYEFIRNLETGENIPYAKDNTDYQAYLKWLSEGNTPLPAEEQ